MNRTDLLTEPPPGLKKSYQHDYWRKICLAVIFLAETGVSTAPDLTKMLSQELGIFQRANSLQRLIKTLANDGLINSQVVRMDIVVNLTILQLTDYGKELAENLGAPPIESEYERILRLHDGAEQPKHTAQVLFAAYQARLRGLQAKVMPFESIDYFQPDLLLIDQQRYREYCEVETHSRNKPQKWMGKRKVNLILPNPTVRYWMVQRVKALAIPGMATDLKTIAQKAKQGDLADFWLESWL